VKLGSNKFLAGLAVLFAAAAAFAIYIYTGQEGISVSGAPENMTTVIVAVQNIPANVTISSSMVEEAQIPEEFVLPNAIKSQDAVVGGISKADIYKGEQMVSGRVFRGEMGDRFAYFVPSSKRGVAFAYSPVMCVGGLIHPGDMIDVLLTYIPPGAEEEQKRTATIVQNIEVLAVGTVYAGSTQTEGAENLKETVTLALTPREAEVVTLASNYGSLKFALRSPVDTETEKVAPATTADFSQ